MGFEALIKGGINFDTSGAKRGIKDVKDETNQLKKTLGGLKGSLAGAFSLGAIGAGLKSLINDAEEIGNAAAKVGQSTDVYQAFANAVKSVGGSAENAFGAMGDLQQRVSEANDGNATAIEAFEGLGISVSDLATNNLPLLLDMVAKSFSETKNFSDAAKVLGADNLRAVSTALDEIGKVGLPAFVKGMENAGQLIDSEFIVKAADANKTLFEMSNRVKVFAVDALTAFTAVVDALGRVSVAMEEAVPDLFKTGFKNPFAILGPLFGGEFTDNLKKSGEKSGGISNKNQSIIDSFKSGGVSSGSGVSTDRIFSDLVKQQERIVGELQKINTNSERTANGVESLDIETGVF